MQLALDELVVVGYAVQKKKELTGSTSSLKAKRQKAFGNNQLGPDDAR